MYLGNDEKTETQAPRPSTQVSVVVLAWGAEPDLEACVLAILASVGVDVHVVVVDNGADPASLRTVSQLTGVSVIGPPVNRGFAGGCNFGVENSEAPLVALINSDAFVAPDALARLCEMASKPDVGIASASLRLYERPTVMNSSGNPVHLSGLTWSGGFGEPAADHDTARRIPSATGAALMLQRRIWDDLGGFDPEFFAYLEDTELSLRAWQRGLKVMYVPDAVVLHRYEFSRNANKMYLLERNRLLLVSTLYSRRTLIALAPILLAFEGAMVLAAARGGWLRSKLRGWAWMWSHRSHVKRRRAQNARSRRVTDRELSWIFTPKLDPANIPLPPGIGPFNAIVECYWRFARGVI